MKTITVTRNLTDEEFDLLSSLAAYECFQSVEDFLLFCMIDGSWKVRERVEQELQETPMQ